VTKESGGQENAESGEHPASQDIGGIVVPEVQCRKDHEAHRREGAESQTRHESKHVVDTDQGCGDVAAGEGVTLDSLQDIEEVPDRFGDKETGELRSVGGRQRESGPEGRDRHIARECAVVGQKKSDDTQVEGPSVFACLSRFLRESRLLAVEGSEQHERQHVVHQVRKLEELGEPWGPDPLEPKTRVSAQDGPVEPDQEVVPVSRVQLWDESQRVVDPQNRDQREEGGNNPGQTTASARDHPRLQDQEDGVPRHQPVPVCDVPLRRQNKNDEAGEVDARDEIRHSPVWESPHGAKPTPVEAQDRHAMNNLTCNCLPRLDGVPPEALRRLFPEPSSTAPLLSLLQESGMDGFNLRSIVVSKDDVPILLLPLFESRFDLSSFAEGWIQRSLKAAACLFPSLLRPRILGVGLLVGEWSEIGIDPQIDAGTREAAWTLAMGALRTLATELKSDIVAFYNFNHFGKLPGEVFTQFNRVQSLPCARLPITFHSLEEYLSRLSSGARKDLRRKMRVSPAVTVIRSRHISPFLDRIYELYLRTVERCPMALGVHNRLFLETICDRVPGAEYTLYFVQQELVAFNLLVITEGAMVDKYFCMDYTLGRKYNLYFLSWLENVRYCVEHHIPLYHAGQGAEDTKAHLGATSIPGFILFKHRRPVVDRILVEQPAAIAKILRYLGFWPVVPPLPASDVLPQGERVR
jgi:hypothetical protein